MQVMEMKCDIKDISLADQGKKQIEWAFKDLLRNNRLKD